MRLDAVSTGMEQPDIRELSDCELACHEADAGIACHDGKRVLDLVLVSCQVQPKLCQVLD